MVEVTFVPYRLIAIAPHAPGSDCRRAITYLPIANVPNSGFMALPRCLEVSISRNNRRVPVRTANPR